MKLAGVGMNSFGDVFESLHSAARVKGLALLDATHACLGLTRTESGVQEGEETRTEMSSFLLCGDRQLHDLHSKLRLEHPRGTANQLHK